MDGEKCGRRVRPIGMTKVMHDMYHREMVSGCARAYRIRRAKLNERMKLATKARKREQEFKVVSLIVCSALLIFYRTCYTDGPYIPCWVWDMTPVTGTNAPCFEKSTY